MLSAAPPLSANQLIGEDREVMFVTPYTALQANVHPLILSRNATTFTHQANLFNVEKTHKYYPKLLSLMACYYQGCHAGDTIEFDLMSKFSFDDIREKDWYVIDLRSNPDVFKNQITIKNIEKASSHPQIFSLFLLELYRRSRGLVVFVDHVTDVPASFGTLCVWGMTSATKASEYFTLVVRGATLMPRNRVALMHKNTVEAGALIGYHRLEQVMKYVSFPQVSE